MATTQTGFAVATIDDIEQGDVNEGRVRHKVREHFGIEGFGVNAFRAVEAGGAADQRAHRSWASRRRASRSSTSCSRGKARFTIDGDEIDAPAGTLVYVEPGREARRRGRRAGHDGARSSAARRGWRTTSRRASWSARCSGRTGRATSRARRRSSAGAQGAPGPPARPLQPRLLRGPPRRDATPPSSTSPQSIAAEQRFAELARDDDDFEPRCATSRAFRSSWANGRGLPLDCMGRPDRSRPCV